uniref:SH2 domain-containing protein n=1 Tax=Mesocestoides corti TaxID=53468 RepID=A0A5K3FUF9_MESCO
MRLVLLSCFSFAPHSPLQGRLNDQDGWFPASHVDIPFTADRAVATISHQASRDRVTRIISLSDVAPQPSWGTSTTNPASSEPNSGEFEGEILIVDTVELHSSSPPTPTATKPPLSSCPWYFGEMDRAEATQLLTGCEDGTFLVRISKNVSRMGEYSLSVVYHHPRHIRIQRSADSSFYLCSPQRFKSLEALVDFYCRVSLNECFDEVQTCLRFPYQRCPEESVLFYARAQHDFGGDANPRMLSLTRGDLVHVISTRGNERGWWKGWLNGRIGFFPLSFVSRQP